MISCSVEDPDGGGGSGGNDSAEFSHVTSIDTSEPNWPYIYNITITKVDSTHSTIDAKVKNVTAYFNVHADLTDLVWAGIPEFDVLPDTYPGSWNYPGVNDVAWTNIEHPDFASGMVVTVEFWVYNSENNTLYCTYRMFSRSGDDWNKVS